MINASIDEGKKKKTSVPNIQCKYMILFFTYGAATHNFYFPIIMCVLLLLWPDQRKRKRRCGFIIFPPICYPRNVVERMRVTIYMVLCAMGTKCPKYHIDAFRFNFQGKRDMWKKKKKIAWTRAKRNQKERNFQIRSIVTEWYSIESIVVHMNRSHIRNDDDHIFKFQAPWVSNSFHFLDVLCSSISCFSLRFVVVLRLHCYCYCWY